MKVGGKWGKGVGNTVGVCLCLGWKDDYVQKCVIQVKMTAIK